MKEEVVLKVLCSDDCYLLTSQVPVANALLLIHASTSANATTKALMYTSTGAVLPHMVLLTLTHH